MRRLNDRTRLWASFLVMLAALGFFAARYFGGPPSDPASPAGASAGALEAAGCQDSGRAALRGGSQPVASSEESIAWYQDRLRLCPDDQRAYSQLGAAYLQRLRETGDPSFYAKAEELTAQALARDPNDETALALKGLIAAGRHQFAQALEIGQAAQRLSPQSAQAYGLIADAQIELGRYDEAGATLQTMVDLRPDLASYSRISYIRELSGDLPGAIDAMQQAVAAGSSSPENVAWTLIQLGNLYFGTGRLSDAERCYNQALALAPDFVHGRAALARLAAVRGDFATAREIYADVTARMPLAEYVIAAGELEIAAGDRQAAQRFFDLVGAIDTLNQANGMTTDLEMALFLADHGDSQVALERARAAYAQRPGIYGAATLAWALSQAGQQPEAQRMMDLALSHGTQDALLFYHAGMIAQRNGDHPGARRRLEQALALNPFFSPVYAQAARQALAALRAQ